MEALLLRLGEPSLETVEGAVAQLWSESGMPEPVRAQVLAALGDPSSVSASLRGLRPNPRGSGPNVTQRLEALVVLECGSPATARTLALEAEGSRVEFRNLRIRELP